MKSLMLWPTLERLPEERLAAALLPGELLLFLLALEAALLVLLIAPILIGRWLLQSGSYAQALPWFRWCYRIGRFIPGWRGPMAINLCACYTYLGDTAEALPYAEEAVEETSKGSSPAHLKTMARSYLGIVLTRLGHFERAEALFDEVLAEARLSARLRTDVEACAAGTYINRGRLEDAQRLLEKIVLEGRAQPDTLALAEANLSVCHFYQGETEKALAFAQRAAQKQARTPWIPAYALSNCLIYLSELNRLAEAKEIEEKLLPMAQGVPSYVQAPIYRAIARRALHSGDLDRARAYAEQAYPLDPNPNAQAGALMTQAEVFAARQNAHRAATLCDEILRLNVIPYYRNRAETLKARMEGHDQPALTADTPASSTEHIARLKP